MLLDVYIYIFSFLSAKKGIPLLLTTSLMFSRTKNIYIYIYLYAMLDMVVETA